jgi:hypothetical protein
MILLKGHQPKRGGGVAGSGEDGDGPICDRVNAIRLASKMPPSALWPFGLDRGHARHFEAAR